MGQMVDPVRLFGIFEGEFNHGSAVMPTKHGLAFEFRLRIVGGNKVIPRLRTSPSSLLFFRPGGRESRRRIVFRFHDHEPRAMHTIGIDFAPAHVHHARAVIDWLPLLLGFGLGQLDGARRLAGWIRHRQRDGETNILIPFGQAIQLSQVALRNNRRIQAPVHVSIGIRAAQPASEGHPSVVWFLRILGCVPLVLRGLHDFWG